MELEVKELTKFIDNKGRIIRFYINYKGSSVYIKAYHGTMKIGCLDFSMDEYINGGALIIESIYVDKSQENFQTSLGIRMIKIAEIYFGARTILGSSVKNISNIDCES